jgi:hypothetical protein
VDTSTLSAHESELAPRAVKLSELRDLACEEALLNGDYERVLRQVDREIVDKPDDVHLWYFGAVAELELHGSPPSRTEGLGRRIVKVLKGVIGKRVEFADSVLEGARIALNYRSFPFSAEFEAFFWPELSSKPTPDSSIQLAAFCSSRYVDPWVLRFLPKALRTSYREFLNQSYTQHRVIAFEAWRAMDREEEGFDTPPVGGIDQSLAREVFIEHAVASTDYDGALKLARELAAAPGERYGFIAKRWIAECLLLCGSVTEAIDYVCNACIEDKNVVRMMPLAQCAFLVDKRYRALFAGKLSTPVLLDLYTRNHDAKYASERNYAYEDFLVAHELERPSQLREFVDNFDRSLLLYYLRFICVPEVMQDSVTFNSSRELEEERRAVCVILAEIDADNLEEHEKEIRDITRQLVVIRGVRAVEQSKIFVDLSAIRRWADKNLKESFARYQALLSAGLDAGGTGIDVALRDLLAGTPVSEKYLRLPENETSQLLVNMLSSFLRQCLIHPEHGLDCYLSMRLRHGALAGQLRAPLEHERIVSQREGPLDEYKSNEHWVSELSKYLSPELVNKIDEHLCSFSGKFDAFVDRFAGDYIQIRSDDKPKGLFELPLNVLVVRALASEISTKVAFEEFIDVCAELFWQLLEPCLRNVHQTIDSTLRPELTGLFESLRTELNKLEVQYLISELDAAILNAQTKAQQKLEQVKDWFRIAKPLTERYFTFEEMVDIGLECVTNAHPDFRPRFNVSLSAKDSTIRYGQLSLFSDIFVIVFDNVRKHSGLTEPRVAVSARIIGDRLEIEIVNEVSPVAVTPEREERVNQIREAISQDGYLRAVRSEGGTGLKKLRNILRSGSDPDRRPEFGFGDNVFSVKFTLRIWEIVQEVEEEASNA